MKLRKRSVKVDIVEESIDVPEATKKVVKKEMKKSTSLKTLDSKSKSIKKVKGKVAKQKVEKNEGTSEYFTKNSQDSIEHNEDLVKNKMTDIRLNVKDEIPCKCD